MRLIALPDACFASCSAAWSWPLARCRLARLAQDDLCSEVDKAFSSIPQNCADLERNSLCHSHPHVEASFADDGEFAEDFSQSFPARVLSLACRALERPRWTMEQGRWGVAIINLRAKLPQTYEGPGVIVMLAGDAEVINEIDPASVAPIGEPLSTAPLVETTLFKNPGIIPRPVGTAAVDEVLLVDAYDDTGEWLRVVNDGKIAWVERKHVARLNAMETLPTIGIGASLPLSSAFHLHEYGIPRLRPGRTDGRDSDAGRLAGQSHHQRRRYSHRLPGHLSAGASQCAQPDRAPRQSDYDIRTDRAARRKRDRHPRAYS